MNGKPVYKLMDGKGRVLIPNEMRAATGMDYGDIVRLGMHQTEHHVSSINFVMLAC